MIAEEIRWLANMPKVELHLHLEGTLEPEMLLRMAARNGISLPWPDQAAVRRAYHFEDLQSFLNLYYQAAACLLTAEDFFELTLAYLHRCRQECVVHTEMFFDPQTHLSHGVALPAMLEGIAAAQKAAERDWEISSALILCLERDRPVEGTVALVEEAARLGGIVGIGLDSAERDNPPGKFRDAFAAARSLGLHRVAHAGEEGPAAYISEALEVLAVERIDHGVRALESPELVERLVREKIPLTVCPFSNVALGGAPNLSSHSTRRLLEAGLVVTVNSDDPAYFGGYVTANLRDTWAALDLSWNQAIAVQRHAIAGSFLAPKQQQVLHQRLDTYLSSLGA